MSLFLKILVAVLIFFVPFSFAATQPWAFSVLQGGVLLAWIGVLVSRRTVVYCTLLKIVAYAFGVVIGLALIQSLFPQTILDKTVWYPVTLMRLYTLQHVSLFATYLGIVLLVPQVYASFNEIKRLAWVLVVAAGCVELCALIFPHGGFIPWIAGLPTHNASVGPFLNRNHAGMFFVLNALLALGLFFTHQLHYKKLFTREQKNAFVIQQICLGLITVGLMLAAVFTRSRGAMLSLMVGLFGYAFLCVWCVPDSVKKRVKRMIYTLILLSLSVTWCYVYLDQINSFAHRQTGGPSDQTRKMLYLGAGQLLKKYPLWGIGLGAMPVAINEYTQWDPHQYIGRLHNDWLEVTLGIGYVGAGCVLLLLLWFARSALKRLKHLELRKQFLFAALLSASLAMGSGCLVDFHFFIPGCAFVFLLLLGMMNAPTFHKGHVHAWHLPWIAVVILVALGAAATYVPLQETRCWRAFTFGHGLKTQAKLEAYQQGLAYYPSPRYAVRLGNSYYNAAVHNKKDPIACLYYLEQAHEVARTYLEKYPKEKELSRLYLRTNTKLL